MLVFGGLMPALGPHLFWTEVVLGYFQVAGVAAAANMLAGCLIYVRSAHDDLRAGCAALLRAQGLRISRLGTAAGGAAAGPGSAAAGAAVGPQGVALAPQGHAVAADAYLASLRGYVDGQVAACLAAAGIEGAAAAAKGGGGGGSASADAGLPPLPAGARQAGVELGFATLELSLKTVSGRPLCALQLQATAGFCSAAAPHAWPPELLPACSPAAPICRPSWSRRCRCCAPSRAPVRPSMRP